MNQTLEHRIFTYSTFLKNKYGQKVFRVGLSTGIMCPHRQTGGCIYCNPHTFTGEYQYKQLSISEQMEDAVPRIKKSCGDVKLLAYFQDETSTAGPLDQLKQQFSEALLNRDVVGLIVSTRPDYVSRETLEMLSSFEVPVTIEFGVQSIHDKSLKFLERGHDFATVQKAIDLCAEFNLEVGVHLITGIPGETFEDMLKTVEWVASQPNIKQAKFHNLVVYQGTRLTELFKQGSFVQYTIEQHIIDLANLLPHLRGDISVSRLFTSNVRQDGIALGDYPGNKTKWMNQLRLYMMRHNLVQGSETEIAYDYQNYGVN